MWFRNLQLFCLPAAWINLAALEEQLARGVFSSCPSNQPKSRGWTAPRRDGSLVFSLGNHWLIALTTEERQLSAAVVNQEVKARCSALEEAQGYAPGRKQLKELRERVAEELLPGAFTRLRTTFAWIDPLNGWFGVNASSLAKAEEVIEHLRHCLNDFPVAMLHTQVSPSSAMADWLASSTAPNGFTVDRDCELKSAGEEKSTVRYSRHPLDGAEIEAEIKAHLAAGKLPTKLALTWDDRISFVLGEKLEIKRLAFLDLLKEEAAQGTDTVDDQFDADFALMTGEFVRFIPALVRTLGGEVLHES